MGSLHIPVTQQLPKAPITSRCGNRMLQGLRSAQLTRCKKSWSLRRIGILQAIPSGSEDLVKSFRSLSEVFQNSFRFCKTWQRLAQVSSWFHVANARCSCLRSQDTTAVTDLDHISRPWTKQVLRYVQHMSNQFDQSNPRALRLCT